MRYAIFDLDGTLVNGYLSTGFIHHLYNEGLFDAAKHLLLQSILKALCDNQMTYDEFVNNWAKLWAKGISGQKVVDIEAASRCFIKENKHLFYDEAKKIIKFFKKHGFKTYVVSTAMAEIVNSSCDYLN